MTDETRPDDEMLSADERAQALDPTVGTGTPETAPWEEPAVAWFKTQPIVAMLVAANVPLLTGLAGSVGEGAPWWASALLGAGVALVNALGIAARRAVTPTARPRDNTGNALTP
jgi:hypothetical protein